MRELVFGDEILSLDEYENAVNALTDEKNALISVNNPASAK